MYIKSIHLYYSIVTWCLFYSQHYDFLPNMAAIRFLVVSKEFPWNFPAGLAGSPW